MIWIEKKMDYKFLELVVCNSKEATIRAIAVTTVKAVAVATITTAIAVATVMAIASEKVTDEAMSETYDTTFVVLVAQDIFTGNLEATNCTACTRQTLVAQTFPHTDIVFQYYPQENWLNIKR